MEQQEQQGQIRPAFINLFDVTFDSIDILLDDTLMPSPVSNVEVIAAQGFVREVNLFYQQGGFSEKEGHVDRMVTAMDHLYQYLSKHFVHKNCTDHARTQKLLLYATAAPIMMHLPYSMYPAALTLGILAYSEVRWRRVKKQSDALVRRVFDLEHFQLWCHKTLLEEDLLANEPAIKERVRRVSYPLLYW